jgi:glutathione S-transferase
MSLSLMRATLAPLDATSRNAFDPPAKAREQAMTKPEIIGSAKSTYTWVVRMVCEEKGIDYALIETPLHAPEIMAIHPLGKMPVLRHGEVELFESKAIATWLDRSFAGPRLFPDDPRRAALVEQWVSLVNTVIDRTLIRTYLFAYIATRTADGAPDRDAIAAVMPAVRQQLEILDRAVAKTGYLVDDQFTFADINLLPILYRVGQFPEGAEALAAATHLARYFDRHAARPSFIRTIPPAGPPRRA